MASKNLLKSKSDYSRYYGDFRGVDFSSDHTQVHENRLAYAVNMYRDYQSEQGKALETIPGFRRRVNLPSSDEVYGIHYMTQGDNDKTVFIHAGKKLYRWSNYPRTVGVPVETVAQLTETGETVGEIPQFKAILPSNVYSVIKVARINGAEIGDGLWEYDSQSKTLTVLSSELEKDDDLQITFLEGEFTDEDILFSEMNERKSTSFVFNNRIYFIDGKNYLVYDGSEITRLYGKKDDKDMPKTYIPTTYINIIPGGENANKGEEYEQRNLLQPLFRHTFIADGETKEFFINEDELWGVGQVYVYDREYYVGGSGDYGCNFDSTNNSIKFNKPPPTPQSKGYPEHYAGVEITCRKDYDYTRITKCTIATVFDGRVFLSGNPDWPNYIFFCGINNKTGFVDPTYFGVLNYVQDGVENARITGMIPVANTLMVLKNDTQQDGSVYFHTPMQTGKDVAPINYPATPGLSGTGCLGACINFLDDPIFVSRLGLEAMGQLSVRYERAIEHRSSLIDAKLTNMDLTRAVLEEWNGYLILLVDGKIFMADSRQRYTHDVGTMQYEWYYLEDIGVWHDQYPEYRYARTLFDELKNIKVEYITADGEEMEIPLCLADAVYDEALGTTRNYTGQTVNAPDGEGKSATEVIFSVTPDTQIPFYYTVCPVTSENGFCGYAAYLCEAPGNKTGGVFNKATTVKTVDENLFFGTENGVVCSFNFDMRDGQGEIPPKYYSFDERTIFSGCATKMDSCGIPHLAKTTVKKSTVIKTKVFQSSAVKIKVRTNRKPYEQIDRVNSTLFSFESMDFSDFSFLTMDDALFAIGEKEKKWVEKQYFLYSDEFAKPFALYYVAFRYSIAGRYKE